MAPFSPQIIITSSAPGALVRGLVPRSALFFLLSSQGLPPNFLLWVSGERERERAEDGELRWEDVSGRPGAHPPSPPGGARLKINAAAGAAARVGPDSCARTANMDAHQVPRRWGAAAGGSRWELVGRAGGSGRGKGAEEGEEEEGGGGRRGEDAGRRSGPARSSPRGEGCPAHPTPAPRAHAAPRPWGAVGGWLLGPRGPWGRRGVRKVRRALRRPHPPHIPKSSSERSPLPAQPRTSRGRPRDREPERPGARTHGQARALGAPGRGRRGDRWAAGRDRAEMQTCSGKGIKMAFLDVQSSSTPQSLPPPPPLRFAPRGGRWARSWRPRRPGRRRGPRPGPPPRLPARTLGAPLSPSHPDK